MIEIIAAIDLIDGKCVRLRQGDFSQKTAYADDPLAVAKQFEAGGIRRLHMVDLDGARHGRPKHLHVLENIARQTSLVIDFSGGIRTDADMEAVFENGASIAAAGSVAVRNRELFLKWLDKYGADRLLLGLDVRNEQLAVQGWTEQTTIGIFDFLEEMINAGVRQVFCTDISKDGLLKGPSIDLYERILNRFPSLKLIASGGVGSLEDLQRLTKTGCSGVIVGKAIYEGLLTMQDLRPFLQNQNPKSC